MKERKDQIVWSGSSDRPPRPPRPPRPLLLPPLSPLCRPAAACKQVVFPPVTLGGCGGKSCRSTEREVRAGAASVCESAGGWCNNGLDAAALGIIPQH